MKFTPKTEKEIQEENLLPEGEYDFEVTHGENAVSKNGNDMIKLRLKIFASDGRERLITDYLMEQMSFKLRHACDACRILDRYESGELLAEDFIGRAGKLILSIRKDKTGQYPDQNQVKDYVKASDESAHNQAKADGYQKPPVSMADELDDAIPF